MHGRAVVDEVLKLRDQDLGARRIARQTEVPLGTVRDWLAGRVPGHSRPAAAGDPACAHCRHEAHAWKDLPPSYDYLLGVYLGDGCLSLHPRGVYRLRVFLDLRHPGIVRECEDAICEVVPRSRVNRVARASNYTDRPDSSYVEVSAYSTSWRCLFPQHGPGRKHLRPIHLTDWQSTLVERYPELLLRGLIHSDGCRFMNTGKNWAWPRYAFSNYSADIRQIFCDACDLLGLRYSFAKCTVYVSRKADVGRMDAFIGPKSRGRGCRQGAHSGAVRAAQASSPT